MNTRLDAHKILKRLHSLEKITYYVRTCTRVTVKFSDPRAFKYRKVLEAMNVCGLIHTDKGCTMTLGLYSSERSMS